IDFLLGRSGWPGVEMEIVNRIRAAGRVDALGRLRMWRLDGLADMCRKRQFYGLRQELNRMAFPATRRREIRRHTRHPDDLRAEPARWWIAGKLFRRIGFHQRSRSARSFYRPT